MSAAAPTKSAQEKSIEPVRSPSSSHPRRIDGTRSDGDRTHRQTLTYGLSAFGKIIQAKVSADPPSYEVWYEYVRGQTPALTSAIDEIVQRNQVVSASDLNDLHKQFFSPSRFVDRIETISHKMDGAMSGVLTVLDAAAWSADSYQANLEGMTEELSRSQDHAALRVVIESLIAATADMERKNKDLSACLNSSMGEIAELQASLATVRAESMTDALTTLANRKHFDATLGAAIVQYGHDRQPVSLLLCDVDHFKKFNDTFGHLTGDRVLTLVGTVLKQSVRGQDTPARYGGEEFAIILPETSLHQARAVGENIRKAVSRSELVKRSTGENLGRVTISVGVAEVRDDDTSQSLIDRADRCLYEAKRQGRDRVVSEDGAEAG